MTPSVPFCIICNETDSVIPCDGCQKYFCSSHISPHREELVEQMEEIKQDHDLLQQDMIEHPLLSRINTWEQESIKKIQIAAEIARIDLQQIFDHYKNEMKLLTNDFQLNNYTEIDLHKWIEQLKELRKMVQNSLNISFIDDDKDSSIIHLIQIHHQTAINPRDNLSLSPQEKFGKVIGASNLSEDGLVATHSGFIFGCSNISGTNLYSSGITSIHFRLEKKSSTCPFFGIYSSSQEMTIHILSSPSVYGWWEFDQRIINGQKHGCQTNKTFQSGDDFTLTLDCNNKHILLQHHRTSKLVHHSIDIQLCPLPWKVLVRLYGAVSRVRILQ
jgi:hypothetical protein